MKRLFLALLLLPTLAGASPFYVPPAGSGGTSYVETPHHDIYWDAATTDAYSKQYAADLLGMCNTGTMPVYINTFSGSTETVLIDHVRFLGSTVLSPTVITIAAFSTNVLQGNGLVHGFFGNATAAAADIRELTLTTTANVDTPLSILVCATEKSWNLTKSGEYAIDGATGKITLTDNSTSKNITYTLDAAPPAGTIDWVFTYNGYGGASGFTAYLNGVLVGGTGGGTGGYLGMENLTNALVYTNTPTGTTSCVLITQHALTAAEAWNFHLINRRYLNEL